MTVFSASTALCSRDTPCFWRRARKEWFQGQGESAAWQNVKESCFGESLNLERINSRLILTDPQNWTSMNFLGIKFALKISDKSSILLPSKGQLKSGIKYPFFENHFYEET